MGIVHFSSWVKPTMYLSVGILASLPSLLTALVTNCTAGEGSLYDHTLELLDKSKNISLSDYKGKVVLLSNVATFWTLTTNHYLGFAKLKKTYGKRGFEILGVPSQIFENQEPTGDAVEIMNAIKYVRPGKNHVPDFPLFSRVHVAGTKSIPLYVWATSRCPAPHSKFVRTKLLLYEGISMHDVRWNWEKILFDKSGQPYKRYSHKSFPSECEKDIQYLLDQPTQKAKTPVKVEPN